MPDTTKTVHTEQLVYIEDYEELFTDIQQSGVFTDQKMVVDSIPRMPVKEIVSRYREQKKNQDFDIKKFFDEHFRLPETESIPAEPGSRPAINAYIDEQWNRLTRHQQYAEGTLIPLPERFVVPGGRFREVFYWDSYFTMLGLQVAGRIDLIENMLDNFASLIDRFGLIPNGNRTYFLSRSQPPFFSFMIELLAGEKGEEVYLKYLPQLEREYLFWMKGEAELAETGCAERRVVRLKDGVVLNRYWDELNRPRPEGYLEDMATAEKNSHVNPEILRDIRAGAESGWDFSSRWFGDEMNLHSIRTTRLVPVDLNCILLHVEKTLAYSCRLAKEYGKAEAYEGRSQKRTAGIQEYCWNENLGIFVDYDFENNRPNRAATLGMAYALVLKIATNKQVADIVHQLESRFLQPGGLLTTLVSSGQQWDAPNGWAPLQWMTFQGLVNYGYHDLARKIALNWISNVETVFEKTGKMTEKYNVVDVGLDASGGEYPNQEGFGWTNGVYLKLRSCISSK